jgi:hypothetical protein
MDVKAVAKHFDEFASSSENAQSTILRVNLRIVIPPLAVAQMAKFLHHEFTLDDPLPDSPPKH